ncbi:hypothetical protein INR49_022395 [Caranx melampygus]|nr:hypothetical protein INR49_022395 [Caranx melampygus]
MNPDTPGGKSKAMNTVVSSVIINILNLLQTREKADLLGFVLSAGQQSRNSCSAMAAFLHHCPF